VGVRLFKHMRNVSRNKSSIFGQDDALNEASLNIVNLKPKEDDLVEWETVKLNSLSR